MLLPNSRVWTKLRSVIYLGLLHDSSFVRSSSQPASLAGGQCRQQLLSAVHPDPQMPTTCTGIFPAQSRPRPESGFVLNARMTFLLDMQVVRLYNGIIPCLLSTEFHRKGAPP